MRRHFQYQYNLRKEIVTMAPRCIQPLGDSPSSEVHQQQTSVLHGADESSGENCRPDLYPNADDMTSSENEQCGLDGRRSIINSRSAVQVVYNSNGSMTVARMDSCTLEQSPCMTGRSICEHYSYCDNAVDHDHGLIFEDNYNASNANEQTLEWGEVNAFDNTSNNHIIRVTKKTHSVFNDKDMFHRQTLGKWTGKDTYGLWGPKGHADDDDHHGERESQADEWTGEETFGLSDSSQLEAVGEHREDSHNYRPIEEFCIQNQPVTPGNIEGDTNCSHPGEVNFTDHRVHQNKEVHNEALADAIWTNTHSNPNLHRHGGTEITPQEKLTLNYDNFCQDLDSYKTPRLRTYETENRFCLGILQNDYTDVASTYKCGREPFPSHNYNSNQGDTPSYEYYYHSEPNSERRIGNNVYASTATPGTFANASFPHCHDGTFCHQNYIPGNSNYYGTLLGSPKSNDILQTRSRDSIVPQQQSSSRLQPSWENLTSGNRNYSNRDRSSQGQPMTANIRKNTNRKEFAVDETEEGNTRKRNKNEEDFNSSNLGSMTDDYVIASNKPPEMLQYALNMEVERRLRDWPESNHPNCPANPQHPDSAKLSVMTAGQVSALLEYCVEEGPCIDLLAKCKEALLVYNPCTAIDNYLAAARFGMRDVMCVLIDRIRKDFLYISQTRQFLELHVDMAVLFLQDTFNKVHSELDVFFIALQWIDYNKQARLQHAGRILSCVRYMYISDEDIIRYVEPNRHLFLGPEGQQALLNVYRYQALCKGGSGQMFPQPAHKPCLLNSLYPEAAISPFKYPCSSGRLEGCIVQPKPCDLMNERSSLADGEGYDEDYDDENMSNRSRAKMPQTGDMKGTVPTSSSQPRYENAEIDRSMNKHSEDENENKKTTKGKKTDKSDAFWVEELRRKYDGYSRCDRLEKVSKEKRPKEQEAFWVHELRRKTDGPPVCDRRCNTIASRLGCSPSRDISRFPTPFKDLYARRKHYDPCKYVGRLQEFKQMAASSDSRKPGSPPASSPFKKKSPGFGRRNSSDQEIQVDMSPGQGQTKQLKFAKKDQELDDATAKELLHFIMQAGSDDKTDPANTNLSDCKHCLPIPFGNYYTFKASSVGVVPKDKKPRGASVFVSDMEEVSRSNVYRDDPPAPMPGSKKPGSKPGSPSSGSKPGSPAPGSRPGSKPGSPAPGSKNQNKPKGKSSDITENRQTGSSPSTSAAGPVKTVKFSLVEDKEPSKKKKKSLRNKNKNAANVDSGDSGLSVELIQVSSKDDHGFSHEHKNVVSDASTTFDGNILEQNLSAKCSTLRDDVNVSDGNCSSSVCIQQSMVAESKKSLVPDSDTFIATEKTHSLRNGSKSIGTMTNSLSSEQSICFQQESVSSKKSTRPSQRKKSDDANKLRLSDNVVEQCVQGLGTVPQKTAKTRNENENMCTCCHKPISRQSTKVDKEVLVKLEQPFTVNDLNIHCGSNVNTSEPIQSKTRQIEYDVDKDKHKDLKIPHQGVPIEDMNFKPITISTSQTTETSNVSSAIKTSNKLSSDSQAYVKDVVEPVKHVHCQAGGNDTTDSKPLIVIDDSTHTPQNVQHRHEISEILSTSYESTELSEDSSQESQYDTDNASTNRILSTTHQSSTTEKRSGKDKEDISMKGENTTLSTSSSSSEDSTFMETSVETLDSEADSIRSALENNSPWDQEITVQNNAKCSRQKGLMSSDSIGDTANILSPFVNTNDFIRNNENSPHYQPKNNSNVASPIHDNISKIKPNTTLSNSFKPVAPYSPDTISLDPDSSINSDFTIASSNLSLTSTDEEVARVLRAMDNDEICSLYRSLNRTPLDNGCYLAQSTTPEQPSFSSLSSYGVRTSESFTDSNALLLSPMTRFTT